MDTTDGVEGAVETAKFRSRMEPPCHRSFALRITNGNTQNLTNPACEGEYNFVMWLGFQLAVFPYVGNATDRRPGFLHVGAGKGHVGARVQGRQVV